MHVAQGNHILSSTGMSTKYSRDDFQHPEFQYPEFIFLEFRKATLRVPHM